LDDGDYEDIDIHKRRLVFVHIGHSRRGRVSHQRGISSVFGEKIAIDVQVLIWQVRILHTIFVVTPDDMLGVTP
jgi:hypothetical protein